MYVTEHIEKTSDPLFSYEIIPPLRGKSAQEIIDIVEQVMPYEPPFIDVTSHTAEAQYEEMGDGRVLRRVRRKRPGMLSICGIICNRYKIDTVAHLLCRGFTKEETEDAMIELNFLGIHNVLAIRGDESNYKKPIGQGRSVNAYANELVEQLNGLKRGVYLEDIANSEPIDMCIGVGAYPEKHIESPNLKSDIKNLRRKVDAGADYIVTQMFYDNSYYFDFVKACRSEGIEVPIVPGLKVIDRLSQLTNLPKNFHITIPEELSDEIEANPEHVAEIGKRWCVKQCEGLLNSSVKCLHFYVMKNAASALEVVKELRSR